MSLFGNSHEPPLHIDGLHSHDEEDDSSFLLPSQKRQKTIDENILEVRWQHLEDSLGIESTFHLLADMEGGHHHLSNHQLDHHEGLLVHDNTSTSSVYASPLPPEKAAEEGSRVVYRCKHDRIRAMCKDCKGTQICCHDRVRRQCKECKGGSICSHGRQRSMCVDCGGSQICPHRKQKRQCTLIIASNSSTSFTPTRLKIYMP